jgi:NitT/TauT family transport system substrate-binding protein
MNKKIILIFLLSLFIGVAAGSLLYFGRTAIQRPINKVPIKIAINTWAGFAHAFVAQEKGIFEKNGVKVELSLFENYSDSDKLYSSGQADGIFEVFSDSILHNINNKPTRAVYAVDYSDGGDAIIGKSDLNYPDGLRGKKIGIDGLNSFSHFFVATVLKQANIKISEVELVVVPAGDVLKALDSGKIDIGHTWEPTKSEALAKGYNQFDKAGNYPGLIIDVLSFSSEIIQNREADVQAVVKSLLEAVDFLKSNTKEAIAIMAKAENMSEADMQSGLDGLRLLDKRDNKTAFSYSVGFESLHGTFRAINDFFKENKITDKILDSTDYVDPQFIRRLQ